MDSLCQTVLSVFKFLSEFARCVGKYNVNQTIFAFDKTDQIFLSGQYRSIYIVSDWYLSKIFEVERKSHRWKIMQYSSKDNVIRIILYLDLNLFNSVKPV